jgi:uncharacterized protein (TIGR02271 family)
MDHPSEKQRIVGSFNDPRNADLAADAVRNAGFSVERPSDGSVVVDPGEHPQHAGEVEGILGAYGAREFSRAAAAASSDASAVATAAESEPRRVRREQGAHMELVEEDLRARTRPVQTGEVTIRKEVIEETRTVEVPVRREELVIEQHPIERHPMDTSTEVSISDPLIQQLMERLRSMQPGETLRIPIVQEEVVVYKRPVVVEEITVAKRGVQETAQLSDTVRREEARIEPHGDINVHQH